MESNTFGLEAPERFFHFIVRTHKGDKGDSFFPSLWKLCIISLWRIYLHLPSLKMSHLTDFWFPWVFSWWPRWEVIFCGGCEVVGRLVIFQCSGETMLIHHHRSVAWFALAMLELGWGLENWIQSLKEVNTCRQSWQKPITYCPKVERLHLIFKSLDFWYIFLLSLFFLRLHCRLSESQ